MEPAELPVTYSRGLPPTYVAGPVALYWEVPVARNEYTSGVSEYRVPQSGGTATVWLHTRH